MKRYLAATVCLTIMSLACANAKSPTVAPGTCRSPIVRELEAKQHAAVKEAESMTDQCDPAWLAAEERALALSIQMDEQGALAGCASNDSFVERNIRNIIKKAKNKCAGLPPPAPPAARLPEPPRPYWEQKCEPLEEYKAVNAEQRNLSDLCTRENLSTIRQRLELLKKGDALLLKMIEDPKCSVSLYNAPELIKKASDCIKGLEEDPKLDKVEQPEEQPEVYDKPPEERALDLFK